MSPSGSYAHDDRNCGAAWNVAKHSSILHLQQDTVAMSTRTLGSLKAFTCRCHRSQYQRRNALYEYSTQRDTSLVLCSLPGNLFGPLWGLQPKLLLNTFINPIFLTPKWKSRAFIINRRHESRWRTALNDSDVHSSVLLIASFWNEFIDLAFAEVRILAHMVHELIMWMSMWAAVTDVYE